MAVSSNVVSEYVCERMCGYLGCSFGWTALEMAKDRSRLWSTFSSTVNAHLAFETYVSNLTVLIVCRSRRVQRKPTLHRQFEQPRFHLPRQISLTSPLHQIHIPNRAAQQWRCARASRTSPPTTRSSTPRAYRGASPSRPSLPPMSAAPLRSPATRATSSLAARPASPISAPFARCTAGRGRVPSARKTTTSPPTPPRATRGTAATTRPSYAPPLSTSSSRGRRVRQRLRRRPCTWQRSTYPLLRSFWS